MHTRIGFPIPNPQLGKLEFLWARHLNNDEYQLDSIPLLVFGLSLGDVVVTSVSEQDGLIFDRVVHHSGHSTYRVSAAEGVSQSMFAQCIARLEALGCRFEKASERFLAIDVPPATDVYSVYGILEECQDAGVWFFEEGHCGHPLES
jgi:hypothetical protein